ncbi:hypothetical protein COLO4_30417 [Corchorus olitorius]|uniref:F-box domain-containing protein n=1 Tax=Corchorus olitorius TaxID=93759 RepID=A0A1R3H8L8_9ROSI|nr:hypothetical protein COLO4_30417 [Corchorus olitorius]
MGYIVYMGALPGLEYSPSSHHISILQDVVKSRSFNGFAANLTNEEAKRLASMKGVVSVFPSTTLQILTTRSWDFMGLNETITRSPAVESDTIIGVIDTGIWPESASFQDEGFGPPPKKWKGVCKGGNNFTCNNKIIGARFYSSISPSSARDEMGHGSHTASTAAGNIVKNTSFFGLGQGTARGAVPSARIAAYRVCDGNGCESKDILAAFDDSIADGVDVITISIGGINPLLFHEDVIAIGAFHAMVKGVITLHAGGNIGGFHTITSVAPWIVTVAASTIDRQFIDKVVLGNGKTLNGFSINSFNLNGTKFPLVYGKEVTTTCSEDQAKFCELDCLDSSLVKGKIVLCDQFKGNFIARLAGAVGSIVQNDKIENLSAVVTLPASALNKTNYEVVKSYVNSTKIPEAGILKSEVIKDASAPIVATFSSRGPNSVVLDILKPDLSAPGVNILAAYSPLGTPAHDDSDTRHDDYSIASGTSMACPHAAGVAAYVKTFHPDWSPSTIKSALMTTAWAMDQSKSQGGEFAYGSGHINPIKARDPGLVYETLKEDYIKLLCSIGYNLDQIKAIAGDNSSSCPPSYQKVPPKDLNYPSMTALVPPNESFTVNFLRTVTNVGLANSTYKAQVSPNSGLEVEVVPDILSFKSLQEKKSFNVTVTGKNLKQPAMVSASLVWLRDSNLGHYHLQVSEFCTTRIYIRDMDLISDLPLHIIHQIMSYLSPRDFARTSLLSKQWKDNIRPSFPIFIFNQLDFLGIDLPYFSPRTLLKYTEKFINDKSLEDFTRFVDSILDHFCDSFILFTKLKLERVTLDERMIQKLTGDSPLLEEIAFEQCWGFACCHVPQLQRLRTFAISFSGEDLTSINIASPHPHYCSLDLCERLTPLKVITISSQTLKQLELEKCSIIEAIHIDAPNMLDFNFSANLIPIATINAPCPWQIYFGAYLNSQGGRYPLRVYEALAATRDVDCCTDSSVKCWRHYLKHVKFQSFEGGIDCDEYLDGYALMKAWTNLPLGGVVHFALEWEEA